MLNIYYLWGLNLCIYIFQFLYYLSLWDYISTIYCQIYFIIDFYKKHTDCKNTLEKWYHDVLLKKWTKPSDVTRDFVKARMIKNSRAIFEINGSEYRLIAQINFLQEWVFIKFIGTHAMYDKIDPETVDLYKRKK